MNWLAQLDDYHASAEPPRPRRTRTLRPGSDIARVMQAVPTARFLTCARIIANAPRGLIDDLSPDQVSRHLRKLKRLGFVDSEPIDGRCWVRYRVKAPT